jgi:Protein of unknown function (DUF3604)
MRLTLLLAAIGAPLCAAAVLAACGSGGSSGTSPSEDASAGDGTTPDASGGDAAGDSPVVPSDSGTGGPDGGLTRCADYDPDKNVYWGDLHTHTALSGDAYGGAIATSPTTPIVSPATPAP